MTARSSGMIPWERNCAEVEGRSFAAREEHRDLSAHGHHGGRAHVECRPCEAARWLLRSSSENRPSLRLTRVASISTGSPPSSLPLPPTATRRVSPGFVVLKGLHRFRIGDRHGGVADAMAKQAAQHRRTIARSAAADIVGRFNDDNWAIGRFRCPGRPSSRSHSFGTPNFTQADGEFRPFGPALPLRRLFPDSDKRKRNSRVGHVRKRVTAQ